MNSRIKRKVRKDSILVLDVSGKPEEIDMEKWLFFIDKYGIIFWDSFTKFHGTVSPYTLPRKSIKAFKVVKNKNHKLLKNE